MYRRYGSVRLPFCPSLYRTDSRESAGESDIRLWLASVEKATV